MNPPFRSLSLQFRAGIGGLPSERPIHKEVIVSTRGIRGGWQDDAVAAFRVFLDDVARIAGTRSTGKP